MKSELRNIFIKWLYAVRLRNKHCPVALFSNPGSDLEPVYQTL